MGELEILEEKILQYAQEQILRLVSSWVLENEELLGLSLMHFYDGEAIDIGVEITKFQYNENLISGGKGFKRYYSFILQGQTDINKDFDKIFAQNKEKGIYLGKAIESIMAKLKDRISTINWDAFTTIDEDFYIDIIEAD